MSEKSLQEQLEEVEAELRNEHQRGALMDSGKVEDLAVRRQELNAQISAQAQAEREQIALKQEEYNGGVKEVIYQVFDSIIPAETGHKVFGINKYDELAEMFRQMIDIAVDENNANLHAYIGEQIEARDAKISELNAQIISKDVQLQEEARQAQSAKDAYEILSSNFVISEEKVEQLEQKIAHVEVEVTALHLEIDDLHQRMISKDEQISKLTEEINKPKASGIILPNQTKPSATLQQMMDAAKNKSVKSQVELALSGESFRGKVLLTPPKLGGSDNAAETFQGQDIETDVEVGRVLAPQVPVLDFRFEEESNTVGLEVARDEIVRSDDAPATWGELKALEARIDERLSRLEQQTAVVA